jgi:GTP-binding protein EngB required for normal cell division
MIFIVDLPGYGFARVSKSEKYSWAEMMEGYFATSEKLRAAGAHGYKAGPAGTT